MRSSLVRTQVAPPSSERKTPPSSASTIAQTRWGSAGDTVTPIFPIGGGGMPGFLVSSVQVSPPSVDLCSPEYGPPPHIFQALR